MDKCHCGKNGHALNSINCPVHGKMEVWFEGDEIRIMQNKKEIIMWTKKEWEEDSEVVFCIANAINMAHIAPVALKNLIKYSA